MERKEIHKSPCINHRLESVPIAAHNHRHKRVIKANYKKAIAIEAQERPGQAKSVWGKKMAVISASPLNQTKSGIDNLLLAASERRRAKNRRA